MSSESPPLVPSPRPPADLNPRQDTPLDFPDRDIGEMTPEDYRTLGFMCGLEVHQQLLTRGKLFCRCPAGRKVTRVDAEVLRHMRPTLSELGEYDGCALMEFKTKKEIVYQLERGTVCTYEMDDTPPFPIDEESIRISLEIALLLNLNLVSEIHVMRKQYLDGSIPTGFQRTAMIGLSGAVPFRVPDLGIDRELRLRQLSLEEDSCREVSTEGHRITFRTDRLGTPLTEAVTEPEFETPFEAQAGGRLLARVAQSTGKVRRGPGAARQDVNVSVAGGRRIELKGFAHHWRIPLLTHVEAFRQLNLLRIRAELKHRDVKDATLRIPESGLPWERSSLVVDAGALLRRCDYAPVREALERRDSVCAVRLPGFGGLLQKRTQPGITFAREFADRVRVIACLTARPFLIHSDVRDYGLSQTEWKGVRQALKASAGDAIVVVWGPVEDVATAAKEILARAREAMEGVPAETRTTNRDGTSGFERILPGPDRMYPDTDTPPKAIPDAWVAAEASALPERPWSREDRYRACGLDPRLAERLASTEEADLFDALSPRAGEIARRVAGALLKRPASYLRRENIPLPVPPERLKPIVDALERGVFRAEAFERAVDLALEHPEAPIADVLERFRRSNRDGADLEKRIAETVERMRPLARKPADTVIRWAMGQVMPPFLGRIAPEEVRERLARAVQETRSGTVPGAKR